MVWPMVHNDTPRGRTDHGMHVPHGICPMVHTLGYAMGLPTEPWWTFSHCPTHDVIRVRSMVQDIVNTWPFSQRFPWDAHDIPPV